MCFFSINNNKKYTKHAYKTLKIIYTLHEFALCRSIRTKSRLYHYITSDVPNVAE